MSAHERSECATRPERVGEAAREGACRGVRGAKPLGSEIVALAAYVFLLVLVIERKLRPVEVVR